MSNVWELIGDVLRGIEQAKGVTAMSEVVPPVVPVATPVAEHPAIQTPVAGLPDRQGTFLIPDIYPDDLGETPPFEHLPGLQVMGKEVVGCYLKASEGTGWSGEGWFLRNWARLRALTSPSFFGGAYHFLRFGADGTAQGNYFCRLVDEAGGLGEWGLMPWVDVESGGQGSWCPGNIANVDVATRVRLAGDVRRVTTDFIKAVKAHWPGIRVGLYGRGIFRDLDMTQCHFGQDATCNPAYTPHMVPMDAYGIPLSEIVEWQLCGDGEVYVPGYPVTIPGWGKTDYSVVVNGDSPTMLSTVRGRCLAVPR